MNPRILGYAGIGLITLAIAFGAGILPAMVALGIGLIVAAFFELIANC